MPLVSMRQLLDEGARGGYGVGAFNVNNMEQIQGIMEAARETAAPVIVQASRGGRSYAGDRFLYHLMLAAAEEYPDIPVALHQDHGNSPATCVSAIELGFTSVMMDGSLLEDGRTVADYEYNVQVTREVVEYAHAEGIRHGVRKINVDTDGRLAITAAVREAIAAKPQEFDPRHFTRASREGMRQIVAERIRQFGQAGHAGDYEPLGLDAMRRGYEGEAAVAPERTGATT